jgi:small conductance mechanosensitive channel
MVPSPTHLSVAVVSAVLRQTDPEPTVDSNDGDIVADVGNEIRVTLDRWTAGHLGIADLVAASIVMAVGFALAWFVKRLIRRAADNLTGAALTSVGTMAQLAGGSIVLFAGAFALEILGFSLGPVLILILIAVVALLLLRPMITNLSSGLLLQVRGALDVGDFVSTGDIVGVVAEITTRTVIIDTTDGRRVHVPNSDVLNRPIVNYTVRGRRRSSFDVTLRWDTDLDLAVSTMRLALSKVEEIESDPPPEVQVAGAIGGLVVIRSLVWHAPEPSAERAALDAGLRAVIVGVEAAGLALDGPTPLELMSAVGQDVTGSD